MAPQNDTKESRMIFGILSYLGPLVIISFLVKRDDPFVKFHVKQGLVLFCIEIILSILMEMLWSTFSFYELYRILHLGLLVLSIIGIVNVVQGKEKELPLVGSLSRYFSF